MLERNLELSFNGVNGSSGQPLTPPLSTAQVVRLAQGEKWNRGHLKELKARREWLEEDGMGVVPWALPTELDQAGWGVIFPHDLAEEIKLALKPLLDHRRSEACRHNEILYRELIYRPGESKPKFLARHKVGPGPVDPEQLPYFLLLVGGPDKTPFRFQYQLDVPYAVGRIDFPTTEEYAHYARNVVDTETNLFPKKRKMTFFGVANPDDKATQGSVQHLVKPLTKLLHQQWGNETPTSASSADSWEFESVLAEDATKARLTELVGGEATPAILFTASHGIGFDEDDPRQIPHQGALLCQDWPGPRHWRRSIPTDHYFSAEDISDQADLRGMISFHFACYSAGTPQFDDYAHRESSHRQLAPHSFIARLPQRLLAHPKGGALAMVGHVDRAWSYSFSWPEASKQISVFASAFNHLFDNYPIGAAMEFFDNRYAELSSDLSCELEEVEYAEDPDFMTLSGMWTANNDARSYVVLGDPAIRISKQ